MHTAASWQAPGKLGSTEAADSSAGNFGVPLGMRHEFVDSCLPVAFGGAKRPEIYLSLSQRGAKEPRGQLLLFFQDNDEDEGGPVGQTRSLVSATYQKQVHLEDGTLFGCTPGL